MTTTPAYEKNVRCSYPWAPMPTTVKSINNRASVAHNIITHQDNVYGAVQPIGILDRSNLNKRKGITEIRDLNRITAVNRN